MAFPHKQVHILHPIGELSNIPILTFKRLVKTRGATLFWSHRRAAHRSSLRDELQLGKQTIGSFFHYALLETSYRTSYKRIYESKLDETIPLPAELEFLHQAGTAAINRWLYRNKRVERSQSMYPAVWKILEKRIQKHPEEAGHADPLHNALPIHDVFAGTRTAVPLSLVKLLIDKHPEGIHTKTLMGIFRCILL